MALRLLPWLSPGAQCCSPDRPALGKDQSLWLPMGKGALVTWNSQKGHLENGAISCPRWTAVIGDLVKAKEPCPHPDTAALRRRGWEGKRSLPFGSWQSSSCYYPRCQVHWLCYKKQTMCSQVWLVLAGRGFALSNQLAWRDECISGPGAALGPSASWLHARAPRDGL